MSGHRKKRLGEVLRERKRVSVEELERALLEQQEGGSGLLGELLLQRGFVGKEDLVSALEEVTKIRYVDARFATVEKAVLKLVPAAGSGTIRGASTGARRPAHRVRHGGTAKPEVP